MHITNVWISENETDINKRCECCGCGACENICSKQAISMSYDKEGFIYPKVDEYKCIECGKCLNVCPMLKTPISCDYIMTFGGYSNEQEIIDNCASGGICTALSKYIIEKGGVVYGVKYSEGYIKSEYDKAETFEDLKSFMTSKYVQSTKNKIFKNVKEEVKKGRLVLFVGCPCDVSALKMFIGFNYSNLYTCELVCMGVTSYKVAEMYIKPREKKWGKLVGFNSKGKRFGWFVPCLEEYYSNGKKVSKSFYGTYYGYAFTKFQRPSCAKCPYRGKIGRADIRMGDFWGIKKSDKFWNERGVSSIFVRTENGKKLLDCLQNKEFCLNEVSYKKAAINNNMDLSNNYNEVQWETRNKFSAILFSKGLKSACRKTATWEFWVKHIMPTFFANTLKHIKHNLTDKK